MSIEANARCIVRRDFFADFFFRSAVFFSFSFTILTLLCALWLREIRENYLQYVYAHSRSVRVSVAPFCLYVYIFVRDVAHRSVMFMTIEHN